MLRRTLLKGSLASIFAGAAYAQSEDVLVLDNPELSRRNDPYANLAKTGPHGYAENPIYVEFDDGALPLWIYAPKNIDIARLIVFSHGSLTEPQVYAPLLKFWASLGFVVVAPIHEDAVIREGLRIRQTDVDGRNTWDFSGILGDPEVWRNRCEKCLKAKNKFADIANSVGMGIDASTPIIAGHSYGAFTAQLLLGTSVVTSQGVQSFATDKWSGGILMSPQGSGIMGLNENSWANVTSPLLVMTGGKDVDESNQSPQIKADPYFRSPANYKHFAYFMEGDHTMYSGQRGGVGDRQYDLFNDIKAVTNLFISSYAKLDTQAYQTLYTDLFDRYTQGRIVLQNR